MSDVETVLRLRLTPAARRTIAATCPTRRAVLARGELPCCGTGDGTTGPPVDTQPGRIAPSGNTPECPIAAAGTEASGTGIAADGSHDVIVDVERGPASGFAVPVGDGSYFVFREPAPPALPAPQPPVSCRTA